LIIIEIIGNDTDRVLAINRVSGIERETLLTPGKHIIAQLVTEGGVIIRVKCVELDIIGELVADLWCDLYGGAGTVLIPVGEGIGIEKVAIRIEI
jgi:hypothetical protein